jgi:hypothetical protein
MLTGASFDESMVTPVVPVMSTVVIESMSSETAEICTCSSSITMRFAPLPSFRRMSPFVPEVDAPAFMVTDPPFPELDESPPEMVTPPAPPLLVEVPPLISAAKPNTMFAPP